MVAASLEGVSAATSSMLFVDGTYLDCNLQQAFGRSDVDFSAFFSAITPGTQLAHVHYCGAPYIQKMNPTKYGRQMTAWNALHALSFVTIHKGKFQRRQVICKKCSHRHTTYCEKATDSFVGINLVHAACHRKADRLVVVSGDNDFWPALKMAKSEGVAVEFAFVVKPFESRRKQLDKVSMLRKHSDRYIAIDEYFMARCWRNAIRQNLTTRAP